ncbi:hypothetical protein [Amycolatopsis sp. cmx-8-4]|uniref:hypothetical protein n=1 Tax=Amycolatopsis sp. cmx-8-4 TaxID=2790947 RepID=UPI00397B94A2
MILLRAVWAGLAAAPAPETVPLDVLGRFQQMMTRAPVCHFAKSSMSVIQAPLLGSPSRS